MSFPCATAQRFQLVCVEDDRPGYQWDESGCCTGECRLAAPALSYKTDDLAAVDGDSRAGDRAHRRTAAAVVFDDDVVRFEDAHSASPEGSTSHASSREPIGRRAGICKRHASTVNRQRGWKAQPAGIDSRLGGIPGID